MENKSVLIVPADSIREILPQNSFTELYHLPEFMAAVAPSECWYARVENPRYGFAFFPFTGQKWLWKWRIYQASFCQRFAPLSVSGFVHPEHWETWTQWMESHCWFGSWSFYPQPAIPESKKFKNQYFIFNGTEDEILNRWKSNRKQGLKKAKACTVEKLEVVTFFSELKKVLKKSSHSKWKPSLKEIQILKRISKLELPDLDCLPFGVFLKDECVSLVLLTRFQNRFHYLFSMSSPLGFEMESVTLFFSQMIQNFSGTGLIFDFEGSNIPGVNSFFRSLGAQEEYYGNLTI